jgi:hypothetical protein
VSATDHWQDRFDDGWRAAEVALIDMRREQPSWMSRRDRRRLKRGAYPLAFWVLRGLRVDRHNGDPAR